MRLLGWILLLVGGAIVVYGIVQAITALAGMYQSNLTDPLNQPEGAELNTSHEMLKSVLLGAAGAPFLLAGTIMLKVSLFRRWKKRGIL